MEKLQVIRGNVLGIDVVRGFAPLSLLSRISRADIYDEKNNPLGTQRDLSPKHAREAYDYASAVKRGYWPEVFLCLRKKSAVNLSVGPGGALSLDIDVEKMERSNEILISRADGNHRLEFASGAKNDLEPVDRTVSFCLAMNLTRREEIAIFRDINNNQKSMDTSHLDKIELRLSGEDAVRVRDPALYIASKLAEDGDSVLKGFVYQGGRRPPGAFMPLRGLHSGIQYMLSKQTRLTTLGDADVQLKLIKNYFRALKDWVPDAFAHPKDYVMLRGAGLWGVAFLGAEIIDRVLAEKKFESGAMLAVLNSGKKWNWGNGGDFSGYSGRGGAVKIADTVIRELKDVHGVSMKDLLDSIMKS